MHTDVLIIGAGLAGITAAIRLQELGFKPTIIDASLPEAKGSLGGFVKFSGAKFSLPPAGLGLIPVVGSQDALWAVIENIAGILDLQLDISNLSRDECAQHGSLRQYSSTVLTPTEIDELLIRLTVKLQERNINVINGKCISLQATGKTTSAEIQTTSGVQRIFCQSVFYAGGRLGTETLTKFGVKTTDKKGLDVGFRVEFSNNEAVANLRKLGPDAKIIKNNCRTFCLNVPGEIFRYPFKNLSIPGGIVSTGNLSNFGILYRTNEKEKLLNRITRNSENIPKNVLENPIDVSSGLLGESEAILSHLYGQEIVLQLKEFGNYLQTEGLVNWDVPHKIHLPLIDWHWPTFSKENTFKTNVETVYCLGDASGHARGLLQAAASGWVAAEEYSCTVH